MESIKYHLLNVLAILLFSYSTAITINQFFLFAFRPEERMSLKTRERMDLRSSPKGFDDYRSILESGFFKQATVSDERGNEPLGNMDEFRLLGTISGPARIARALIRVGEKEPAIYRLFQNVNGYRLVRIDNTRVFLKSGEAVQKIDLYTQGDKTADAKSTDRAEKKYSRDVSRAAIKQQLRNNLMNILRGVRTQTYRSESGNGLKISSISTSNILYRYGARRGDIIKKINDNIVESPAKLYRILRSVASDSMISVEVERNGKTMTVDFNVNE
jgi:type II secretion system protein C